MEIEDLYKNGKTYEANMKEVLKIKFWDENIKQPRTVVVYQVRYDLGNPSNEFYEPPYREFYLAVERFEDSHKESAMGVGFTIVDALEDAEWNLERKLREVYGNDFPEDKLPNNPFREAIKVLREQESERNKNKMLLNY
jgi:hypothetical protein